MNWLPIHPERVRQLALVNYSKANAVYTKQFDSDLLAPVAEAMYFNAIPIRVITIQLS